MKQIRRHLTYANVMSSVAVFLILGGATAFAATKIGANQLKANSVKTGKIVKEAVTAGKIKNGAVSESKIADNAVTTNKIANDAVTGEKVKESSLGEVPSAANAQKVGGKSVNDIAMWAFVGSNGTLIRSSGGVTSSKVGTGSYDVNFPRAIDTCAGDATNAAVDTASNPLPAQIALSMLDTNTVRVQTGTAADGTLVDDQFMLVVTC